MDKFNPDANNANSPKATEAQPPHSGVFNNEYPVREYTETPLKDAVNLPEFKSEFPEDQEVTVASFTGQSRENVEVIDTPQTQESEKPAKKKLSLGAKIGAGAAGLLIAGGAAFGISQLNNGSENNTPPEDNPKDTTQVEEEPVAEEPTEQEPSANGASGSENDPAITSENEAQILSELQFTAEMTPEEIGQQYTETLSRWAMAGATPDAWSTQFNEMLNDEEFALEIAKNNTHVYATALFGENYKATADSSMMTFIENVENTNAAYIVYYLRTYSDENYQNTNTENKETWHYELENINVTVDQQSESTLEIVVRQETHVNASQTMFKDTQEPDGHLSDTYLTIDLTNGVPAVTEVSIQDIN